MSTDEFQMDLSEFLLARIAEDEAIYRNHSALAPPDGTFWARATDGNQVGYPPAFHLAECEAKRQIVETLRDDWWSGNTMLNERLLGFLALAYADHPDYRAEWKVLTDA